MRIPVITLEDVINYAEISGRLWGMLRDEGYLYLDGPLVNDLPFQEILNVSREFFKESTEYKMRYYIGRSPIHRGYLPEGEEGDPDCPPDLKEGYDSGLQNLGRSLVPSMELNVQAPWPNKGTFEATVAEYLDGCERIARILASILSYACRLDVDLNERAKNPPNQLRLLHYPRSESIQNQGVGTHTDFECFTLLWATHPGLAVQRPNGDWINVSPRPGSLIVTIGDIMEILTNGALRATPHRVGWVGQERYSFPYFFCLDGGEVVEPAPEFISDNAKFYPSTSVGDHLVRRTVSVFRYLREA